MAVSDLVADGAVSAADTGGWRSASLLARCAFFLLGAIAAACFFGVVIMLSRSSPVTATLTCAACIGVAELLVTRMRFWRMGIEEALWIAGALSTLGFAADHGTERSLAVGLTIAFAAAALRLMNPFCAALALAALGWRISLGSGWERASAICFVLTPIVWLSLKKHFARPSTQRFAQWMSVVLPLFGYLAAKHFDFEPWRVFGPASISVDAMTSLALPLALLIGAIVALVLALRWRQHALLLAFALCVVLLGIELRELSPLSLEVNLIVYGAIVLVTMVVLERRLRRPDGVTSLPLGNDSDGWKIIELGTAAALATASPRRNESTPRRNDLETGGGSYGGAGSSGSF